MTNQESLMLQYTFTTVHLSLLYNKNIYAKTTLCMQIDLHSNISGLLSALPQTPLVSLHHLDHVEPLFPAMDRPQSLHQLMKAAKTDQSRLLQQRICYNHPKNWSISVSWGYSVQIYENTIPPSLLQVPLQTFTEWRRGASPAFMMNTRPISNDSCEMPHYFYFDSVEESSTDGGRGMRGQVVTNYVRRFPLQLPPCLVNGNHSADHVEKIMVISPVTRLEMVCAVLGSIKWSRKLIEMVWLDSMFFKCSIIKPDLYFGIQLGFRATYAMNLFKQK